MRNPRSDTNGLKKGTWTPEEDRKLIAYVTRYGCWNWRQLPRFAGLARCGKSCRLRWLNYLRPDIKRGHYTKEEDELIIKLHHQLGNRWSTIAAKLPGRTDNEIKNHWHTNLKNRHKTQPPDNDDIIVSEARQCHSQGVTDSAASRVEPPDNGKSGSESTSSESSYVTPSESNNQDLVGEHDFSFLDARSEPIMGGNFWTDPCVVYSDLFFYPTGTEPTPPETEAQLFGPISGVSQLWTHNFYDQYCGHFYNSSQ